MTRMWRSADHESMWYIKTKASEVFTPTGDHGAPFIYGQNYSRQWQDLESDGILIMRAKFRDEEGEYTYYWESSEPAINRWLELMQMTNAVAAADYDLKEVNVLNR